MLLTAQRSSLLRPRKSYGFGLVAVAAAIWGSDALFRRGLALDLPASVVVFLEHVILAGITLPLTIRALRKRHAFDTRAIVAVVLVGVGSSALATVLFTKAFVHGSPTTPLLLQKTQPLFAVLGARLLLGERLMPRYLFFFAMGVGAAYMITFPDPLTTSVDSLVGATLALGAAILWALGTVLGKHLSHLVSFAELTGLRFALGLAGSAAIVTFDGQLAAVPRVSAAEWRGLLLLALVPGLMALLIYYRGLRSTTASAATIAELSFPLSAILINYLVFDDVLSPTQWLGVAALSATIVMMTGLASRSSRSLGVVARPEGSLGLSTRAAET